MKGFYLQVAVYAIIGIAIGVFWTDSYFKEPLVGEQLNLDLEGSSIYIFTDPECEPCKSFQENKLPFLREGYEFKENYFYPISSGHEAGLEAVYSTLCPEINDSCIALANKKIQKDNVLMQDLNIKGLPHFIILDDNVITAIIKGDQPLRKFKNALEETK